MHDVTLAAQRFQFTMGRYQQRAAGSLIAAARFDSHESVLDDINATNSIAPADFIQQLNQRDRTKPHSIDTHRDTLFEFDLHLLFAIGSILRGIRNLPGTRKRRIGGVLQFAALMADVPQISIATVNLLAAGCDRNAMRFGVIKAILARFQVPFPPWCDDFKFWSERLISQLEAHLIITLSRATVGNGSRALA